MSTMYYGSICLTDMLEKAKQKHSAFTKAQNGKIYCNVNVWLNDQKDKYGNVMAVQLNSSKENRDAEGKVYIGNMKQSDGPAPISDNDTSDLDVDLDIPAPNTNISGGGEPSDDLPF